MIIEIRIDENIILLNEIPIGRPIYYEKIELALAVKPSRVVDSNNTIIVYDHEGVYLYTDKAEPGRISQVDIQFELQDWLNFAPKSIYGGKFYIGKKEVKNISDILSFSDEVLDRDEEEGDGVINIYLNEICLTKQ